MKILREGNLDLDEFLSRPLFAHLATTQDGIAKESPVWFLWEDGCVWIIGNEKSDTFPSRIKREPRCAIGIVDFDVRTGKVHHVGFRGTATIQGLDRERAIRKVSKYLGSNQDLWDQNRFSLRDPNLVLIKFTPETVVVRDQSYNSRSE